MKYTIKQSSIASLIYVIDETGNQTDCFFMAENKQPEAYPSDNLSGNGVAAWESLPLEVRTNVNRQFGVVFSLPVGSRNEFVNNCVDYAIEIP